MNYPGALTRCSRLKYNVSVRPEKAISYRFHRIPVNVIGRRDGRKTESNDDES